MIRHKILHIRNDVNTYSVTKRGRKRTYLHWRQRWWINTMTWSLHKKHGRWLIAATRNNTTNTRTSGTTTREQKCEEKQLYVSFKRRTSDTSNEKTWKWLRKENLKRETEFTLIAVRNNALRTNHIKSRIDTTQQNHRCRLCNDRYETINHIISECRKLPQEEYKTSNDCVSKLILTELYKKF